MLCTWTYSGGYSRKSPVLTVSHNNVGKPCRNCALANRPCTYAAPDRKVTVSESYLKRLQSAAFGQSKFGASPEHPRPEHGHWEGQPLKSTAGLAGAIAGSAHAPRRTSDPLVENSTAELFVSKLREIEKFSTLIVSPASDHSERCDDHADYEPSKSLPYEYISLSFDNFRTCPCMFWPH